MHPSLPHVEPVPRRIRIRLGGELVADTERARLLLQYGPGGLPTYYLPRDDVRPGVLVDEQAEDGRCTWTVAAGGLRLPGAAWTHPDGAAAPPGLADLVTFSWALLEWYEEDERVVMHARDPYKRVDTFRTSRRVEISLDGEPLARSVRPLMLVETHLPTRWYLPPEDVRTELLRASDLVTVCPYKGTARYWSVEVGGTVHADLAWSYPSPIPENPKIKDLICFFAERVDTVVDGRALERPRSFWSPPDD